MNLLAPASFIRKLSTATVVPLVGVLGLLASAAPPAAARGERVQPTLTTSNLAAALAQMPSLRFVRSRSRGVPVIHVTDSVRYQRVTGFGAAMTDSSASLIHDELTSPIRSRLMYALFSSSGIHLDFVRVPIGASDFSAEGTPYTYDDLPAGQSDPQLARFSIAHDEAYVIPTLRQMLQVQPGIEILATPWTAPPWMKANRAFDDLGDLGTLLPSAYGPLAGYFVKFMQDYAARGIRVSAITAANEPGAGTPYPGMNLSPSDEARFIASYLEPALRAAGLHPKIYGLDRGALLPYSQALLASQAAGMLSGIAWHCYGGAGVMSALHETHPSVDQIVSECSPGIIPHTAAEVAIDSTRNWASAVALWNLALDPDGGPVQPRNYGCRGCTGVVTVSERTHKVRLGLNYYQLGQVSKFVAPGARRIKSERFVSDYRTASGAYGVTPGLDDVAFLNPNGAKVLVAYNNSRARIRFAVSWHGHSFSYTLRRRATVTFTWK